VLSKHAPNNFGVLRLILASLVIVAHSPELIDGNRSRELLNRLFGTITFGELAVDGFFLISGYLILNSYQNSQSIKDYFVKRVLRIYPAFIVASLLGVYLLLPISGELGVIKSMTLTEHIKNLLNPLILKGPDVKNSNYTALNGSMWTIWFEFVCYLTIPAIYFAFKQSKNKIYPILVFLTLSVFLITNILDKNFWFPFIRIDIHHFSRLISAFLIGGLYLLNKDNIVWNQKVMMICLIMLMISLNIPLIAEIGLLSFGSYLLFYFAFNVKNTFLNNIGTKNDISYGIYLYAWPIQIYIIKSYPTISPYALMLTTLILAAVFGFASWKLLEKPCMRLKNKLKLLN
jgi:peptidoglycan/LPS O-acetylase OafA/YrhL